MIVPIKCMPKISSVGLFCLDKFENNQTRTGTTFFRTSKLTELYFKYITENLWECFAYKMTGKIYIKKSSLILSTVYLAAVSEKHVFIIKYQLYPNCMNYLFLIACDHLKDSFQIADKYEFNNISII